MREGTGEDDKHRCSTRRLPLLEHVLRCLDLFRCSGDGDDAICRAGESFIDLDESVRLGTDATNATASLSNDGTSQL